jgi:hypothetical protein
LAKFRCFKCLSLSLSHPFLARVLCVLFVDGEIQSASNENSRIAFAKCRDAKCARRETTLTAQVTAKAGAKESNPQLP